MRCVWGVGSRHRCACGHAGRRPARAYGRRWNMTELAAMYNVVLQARTVTDTAREALDMRTAEGIGLIRAIGQTNFKGHRSAGWDDRFFPIVEDLVFYVVVDPLIAGYTHLVTAGQRIVVECCPHTLTDYG